SVGREPRREQRDRVERRELIRGAAGRRIREGAVELRDLEAERHTRGGAMAREALRFAREAPLPTAEIHDLPAFDQQPVLQRVVPFVGVAAVIPFRMLHQEPDLDRRAADAEALHQYGPYGED